MFRLSVRPMPGASTSRRGPATEHKRWRSEIPLGTRCYVKSKKSRPDPNARHCQEAGAPTIRGTLPTTFHFKDTLCGCQGKDQFSARTPSDVKSKHRSLNAATGGGCEYRPPTGMYALRSGNGSFAGNPDSDQLALPCPEYQWIPRSRPFQERQAHGLQETTEEDRHRPYPSRWQRLPYIRS